MLRHDDDGLPKLRGDDAVELIRELRESAHEIKLPQANSALQYAAFKKKAMLRIAAAELARYYIRSGLIHDERKNQLMRKVGGNK